MSGLIHEPLLVPVVSPPTRDPAKILRAARALIEQGWCRHFSHVHIPDGPDRYCAVGAIRAAAFAETGIYDAYMGAILVLEKVVPNHLTIPNWNDYPYRTKEEVLAKFDEAILVAERLSSV